MASEQTFNEWYFAYCQQHNRTPGMEEVWDAALAADAAPAQQTGAPLPAFLQKAIDTIGGKLNVSGQKGLRHLETDIDHPRGAGIHIASGKDEAMLNAIAEVCNALSAGAPLPLAPSEVVEPGDRILLEVIRLGQIEDGLHPTCGYIQALDRAIARVATPQQATLPAGEADVMKAAAEAFGYEGGLQTINEGDLTRLAAILRAQPQAEAAEPVAKGGEQA